MRTSLDEATADVLHQLVAGGGADPLLVLLAYRAEWIRTSLPRGLAELARGERDPPLQLGPLTDGEIAAARRARGSGAPDPDAVARIVAGRRRAARSSRSSSRARSAPARADALPRTVRAGDHASGFVGLDPATLDALTALAVAEDELDLASVLALTGLGRGRRRSRCSTPRSTTGVLVVAGARYRFRHELVRQALTDELPPHRRLAAAPRRRRAPGRRRRAAPELIADHWLEGERPAGGGRLAAGRGAARGRRRRVRRRARRRSSACWRQAPGAPRGARACAPRSSTRSATAGRPTPTPPRPTRSASPRPRSCAPARRSPS